jgi:hypothetical protein
MHTDSYRQMIERGRGSRCYRQMIETPRASASLYRHLEPCIQTPTASYMPCIQEATASYMYDQEKSVSSCADASSLRETPQLLFE